MRKKYTVLGLIYPHSASAHDDGSAWGDISSECQCMLMPVLRIIVLLNASAHGDGSSLDHISA